MELYIDLSKSLLNTAKLVQKQVQVRGQNGKVFTRMQWVDPNDNAPVMEHGHGHEDSHHARVRYMHENDKMEAAKNFLNHDTARAHKFAQATGMRRNPAHLPPHVVASHIKDHLEKVPQEHIEPHFKTHLKEDQTAHAPLKLEHQDHKLPDSEVARRSGKVGDLDIAKLSEGDRVEDDDSLFYNDDKEADKKLFKSLFGDTSKEGLEYVFSDPDGNFSCKMEGIDSYKDRGNHKCEVGMSINDKDGKYIGMMNRALWRDENGHLNVKNVEFTLHSEHQGKGIADTIYKRSEQYWRHLSGGNPLNVHMSANISVGVYAWAKKGFDFANEGELKKAREEFHNFCLDNSMRTDEVLKNCGVSSLNDLKHSWDFATLDDKQEYDLTDILNHDRVQYKGEIKGTGSIGKAFMLGGKDHWDGVKRLNQDGPHEGVQEIHERKVKATNEQ